MQTLDRIQPSLPMKRGRASTTTSPSSLGLEERGGDCQAQIAEWIDH
jgi:hypothetical protein